MSISTALIWILAVSMTVIFLHFKQVKGKSWDGDLFISTAKGVFYYNPRRIAVVSWILIIASLF